MKKLIPKCQVGTDTTYFGKNSITGTSELPNIEVIANKPEQKYFSHYNDNGDPVYTSDYNLSQQNLVDNIPESEEVKKRKQALIDIKNRPKGKLTGTAKVASDVAQIGIGSALFPLVASHFIPSALPIVKTLSEPLTTTAKYISRFYPKVRWMIPEINHLENNIIGASGALNFIKDGVEWEEKRIPTSEFVVKSLINLPLFGKGSYNNLDRAFNNPTFTMRAIDDFITAYKGTKQAINDGKYVYNFKSLIKNLRELKPNAQLGIDKATSYLESLTGVKARTPKFKFARINSAAGDFDYSTKLIRINPFYHNSNIIRRNNGIQFTGGHERTHDFLDFFNKLRNIPSLSVKNWRYFIPNKNNPISKKYFKEFIKANTHGKSPEETYANYIGLKGILRDQDIDKINYNKEGIKPPKGFISDYESYLIKTPINNK